MFATPKVNPRQSLATYRYISRSPFPGHQAFGAATPDGCGALAMMANATEISEQANEALVYAQELAACRALG